jgi:MSHA biogenesis protein MshN
VPPAEPEPVSALASEAASAPAPATDPGPVPAPAGPALDAEIERAIAAAETPARDAPPAPPPAVETEAEAEAAPAITYRGSIHKQAPEAATRAARLRTLVARLDGPRAAPALAELDQLVAAEPRFVEARLALVAALLQRDQDARAAKLLEDGLALTPAEPRFARAYAERLVERGDAARAHAILIAALPDADPDPELVAFIAALEQRLGRHAEAIARYRAALAAAPERGAWWIGLAISLALVGQAPEAIPALERGLADGELSETLRRYARGELARLTAGG